MYEGVSVKITGGNEAQNHLAGMHGMFEVRVGVSDQGLYHDGPDAEDESECAAICVDGRGNILGVRDYGKARGGVEYVAYG